MKNEFPLISVIIPVYNVEDYLIDCVESIRNQTYHNIEIIIVDDGSTDRCPEICDHYSELDPRVTVMHKKNGGQGSARNMALDEANGEYVAFVDSDDMLDSDCISFLYALIHDENADIAICDYRRINEQGSVIHGFKRYRKRMKRFSGEEAMIVALYWKEFGVAPWAKLFRKELWDEIRFKEDRIYEDMATTYLIYDKANTVVYDNEIKMSYRIRSNSDAHRPFSPKRIKTLETTDEIMAYCSNREIKVRKAAYSRCLATACFILFRIPVKELGEYKSVIEKCKKTIRKHRFGVMIDRNARLKTRLGALCSYGGFGLERLIFSIFIR